MVRTVTLRPTAKHLHRPPLTSTDNGSRLKRRGTELAVLCSEKLSCFLIATSPVEVKGAPYDSQKEAVVAKSKMAVEAGPESPQDAAQNVISEPGNQEAISALEYELWIQRGCPLGSPEVDWFRAEEEFKS